MSKTISLNPQKLAELTAQCRAAGVVYGYGEKTPNLDAVPGKDFSDVDCSGFVRWLIWNASGDTVRFPDGSTIQHEHVKAQRFAKGKVADGKLKDGKVRIAFLTPADGSGVGHVALIHNGKTFESHGSVGPNSRVWSGTGWQSRAHVYVLSNPPPPAVPSPTLHVTINGAALVLPLHIDAEGKSFVRVRDLAAGMGQELTWDEGSKVARIG